jgi:hypothetical protein
MRQFACQKFGQPWSAQVLVMVRPAAGQAAGLGRRAVRFCRLVFVFGRYASRPGSCCEIQNLAGPLVIPVLPLEDVKKDCGERGPAEYIEWALPLFRMRFQPPRTATITRKNPTASFHVALLTFAMRQLPTSPPGPIIPGILPRSKRACCYHLDDVTARKIHHI